MPSMMVMAMTVASLVVSVVRLSRKKGLTSICGKQEIWITHPACFLRKIAKKSYTQNLSIQSYIVN